MMSSLSRWFRSRPHTIVNRAAGRKKTTSQLYVEALEDRTVPSTVQGHVFNDANHNDVQDAGEAGIAGWTVFLDVNKNGIVDAGETTRTTDAAGNYFFDTTNETPALFAYGEGIDVVALKLEVGTGGRHLDTTPLAVAVGRVDEPNAVRNFGITFQPTVGVAPAGPETLVNATAAGVQGGASVAADAAGDYVIAWNTDLPGGGHTISARVFNANGTPRTAEITVATTAGSSATQVAMAGNGSEFVVAWNTAQGIKAQVFNSQGTAVGSTATVLANDAKTTGTLDSVAADATGNFVALYNVRTYSKSFGWSSTHTVKAQLYNSSGSARGSAITVASPNLVNGSQGLAMAGGGNFVVVWNDMTGGQHSASNVYAQQYNASGSKSGSQILVVSASSNPPDWVLGPSVAMNANGKFVVAYTQFGNYVTQIYNANGTASGGPVIFGFYDYRVSSQPALVAMDSAGNVTLAWTDYGQVGIDYPGEGEAYIHRLAAGATTPDPETIVNTTTEGVQYITGIAANGNGSFIAVWQGNGLGDDYGVLAQRYGLPPKIGSFTASANPTAGSPVTLTVSNITDANPGATITRVAFYEDTNNDGVPDVLLGYGTQSSPGVWTFSFTFSSGTHKLFAQALDSYGVLSDPLEFDLQVV